MRRLLALGIASCLAFAATLATTKEAHAGPHIGLDLDLGTAFANRLQFSYGLGGRLGYKVGLGPIFILPEIGGHYMLFGTSDARGNVLYATRAGRVFGGGAIGFGRVVQPSIFGHAGFGWLNGGNAGPAADVGAALDIRIVRFFSLGAAVSYNTVTVLKEGTNVIESARWINFGLRAGVTFF
jgi:hypothetical protein